MNYVFIFTLCLFHHTQPHQWCNG